MVDREHRVFGYQNLLICDGAVNPANPGVNPSPTITAMAERGNVGNPGQAGGPHHKYPPPVGLVETGGGVSQYGDVAG